MKKLLLFFCLTPLFQSVTQAQCIADVHYLMNSPNPCHFVGMVDFENSDCVDFFSPDWKYVWKISGTGDGDLLAIYEGMAFDHVFEKFGGYDFCLEIHKDGSTQTPPNHVECVTYTTCEPCGETEIKYEYIHCPIGKGCDINFSTKIQAENMAGLKAIGKYIFTYNPTPQEILGGVESYEIEVDDIAVEYHPDSGYIYVAEDIHIEFKRGCYTPRLELEMIYDAGAHYTLGGAPCTQVILQSEETIRCIACNEEGFGCTGSILATEVSNAEGTCELFACPTPLGNRDSELDTDNYLSNSTNVFRVSPNPARELVTVEWPDKGHDDITIYLLDAFGRLAAEKEIHGINSTDFDVSGLQTGMYLVLARANGKVISSEKLAIIH